MIHVDGYVTLWPKPGKFYLDDGTNGSLTKPFRWNANDYLPARSQYPTWDERWNGYVYYTPPHEDGECSQHRPEQVEDGPGS